MSKGVGAIGIGTTESKDGKGIKYCQGGICMMVGGVERSLSKIQGSVLSCNTVEEKDVAMCESGPSSVHEGQGVTCCNGWK